MNIPYRLSANNHYAGKTHVFARRTRLEDFFFFSPPPIKERHRSPFFLGRGRPVPRRQPPLEPPRPQLLRTRRTFLPSTSRAAKPPTRSSLLFDRLFPE